MFFDLFSSFHVRHPGAGRGSGGGIAPKILRFHVLANSDSAKDQALKLRVKDLLLEKIRDGAAADQIAGKEELKAYILSESSTLEAAAEDFIHSFGYDYGVHVGIETCRFPVRTYGDMTFPAGMYEAVRVTIGNGAGHNFWCILYPSLCYTDSVMRRCRRNRRKC